MRKPLLLLLLAGCSKGPQADLPAIGAARSLGAEWALINEQVSRGHLTAAYVKTMRQQLREQLQTNASSLTSSETPYAREIQALLGILAEKQGRLAVAVKHFRQAVAENPQDIAALYSLAEAIGREGAAGSDAALETADVALMADELLKIPYAIRLSRATLRNIKANLAISIVMKAAFVAAAIAGVATLWMAVVADTGASVIVIANALRLLQAD